MSSINPNNIDGTYPIAGQDNDSQGFRDNFTNIKNNFTFAASEVSDLQNNAILKSPLSGTTLNNNLNNAQLIGAQISKFTETRNPISGTSGSITVNWSDAHFQTLSLVSSATVTLGSWPTSGFWTSMVLDVTPTAENVSLTLAGASNFVNATNIQGFTANAIAFPSGNVTYRFEFSTYDGGTTVSVRDLYRNYNVETLGGTATFTTVNATTLNIGNPLSNLRVSGTSTLTGNVITNGAQVEQGYRQFKPTGNIAVTANVGINRVLLHPTGTIVSFGANVTLPNTQVDGTIISISSNVTIASLAVTSNWNGVVTVSPFGNTSSVTAGTVSRYMYIAADYVWYKIA
jgi:hypothetical protein